MTLEEIHAKVYDALQELTNEAMRLRRESRREEPDYQKMEIQSLTKGIRSLQEENERIRNTNKLLVDERWNGSKMDGNGTNCLQYKL